MGCVSAFAVVSAVPDAPAPLPSPPALPSSVCQLLLEGTRGDLLSVSFAGSGNELALFLFI